MFWSLIATLFAGLAGAGIGMALIKLSGNRLPKWLTPLMAGLVMMVTSVGQEYGWYRNLLATMGEVEVITTREQQTWWQPWTYVRPFVRGFIAYAPAETVETAEGSGILVVQTQLQERWQPGIVKPILVDCGNWRRAELDSSVVFDDAGQPNDVAWFVGTEDDPFLTAICLG